MSEAEAIVHNPVTEGDDQKILAVVPEDISLVDGKSPLDDTPVISETNTVDSDVSKTNIKKKEQLVRPLFSRTSTTDKSSKQIQNKLMTVETETVDASAAPSVSLPIGLNNNVISTVISNVISNNDILSNNSSISNNLSSLRARKSTLFVDSNQQNPNVTTAQTPILEVDDNASVNGSIRNSKRSSQAETYHNLPKSGATKADLFAAKIANAVGDASDSDSEETFVYESAPDALNSTNTLPNNKTLQSSNPIGLRKLTQRNVSMPLSTAVHPYSPSNAPNIVLTGEDSKDPGSQNIDTENDSDTSNTESHNQQATGQQDKLYIYKSSFDSNHNSSANSVNTPKQPKTFTKYHGESSSRNESVSAQGNSFPSPQNHRSQLRTTTSKLFDVKGSSLRRYSGVPDDVNIEDYIDQYDEEHEIGNDNFNEFYDYDEYADDDELTPLNVNNANNNLRNKMTQHYFNGRSLPNFKSTDTDDHSQDFGYNKDETVNNNSKLKIKKYKSRPQIEQRLQHPYSPHNFRNTKKNSSIQAFKNFIYLFALVFLLLAFGFVAGFFLATTKDLQNVHIVTLDNVIVSYDELIFDLTVEAFNPGFVSVLIDDLELDIFARSSYIEKELVMPIYQDDSLKDVQTMLLGTVEKFDTPLEFMSGFFNRNFSTSKGQIKLLHPGQNSTDTEGESGQSENHKIENESDKWKAIMKKPFELIIRGTLRYYLPFYHNERSVAVTKTVSIDPADI